MLHSHSSAYDPSAVCNSVYVKATGANKEDLEANAFRQAREFFGEGPALEFAHSYSAQKDPDGLYFTYIIVREVSPRQCGQGRRSRRHRHFRLHFCL